jgi:hypothetical protein
MTAGICIKLVVICSLVVTVAAGTNYGYGLLTGQLSDLVENSYGSLDTRLQAQTACPRSLDCTDIDQTVRSGSDINTRFQDILDASKK